MFVKHFICIFVLLAIERMQQKKREKNLLAWQKNRKFNCKQISFWKFQQLLILNQMPPNSKSIKVRHGTNLTRSKSSSVSLLKGLTRFRRKSLTANKVSIKSFYDK